jgi:hypothetical protein
MQSCRRMVHRADEAILIRKRFPVYLFHRTHVGDELGERVTPKRDDNFRLDRGNLSPKKSVARRNLILFGIPVAWRTVLDDVRDKDVASGKAGRPKQLIEELTRGPYEGATLLVFIEAGRLPYQHDGCLRVSLPWHRASRARPELAQAAARDLIADLTKVWSGCKTRHKKSSAPRRDWGVPL